MKERKNKPHINPITQKECSGFKYKKNGKVGCLSCNWVSEKAREDDNSLKTLAEIKDAFT